MNFLKKIFIDKCTFDNLIEGMYAHEYSNEEIKQDIKNQYRDRYSIKVTPLTNPERYDPLNPPTGWAYDPYYEIWIETNES